MCYSAPASFAASGVLAVSGIAILRMPKKKAEAPLAAIPLIFAAHQLIEGTLWLNHLGIVPDSYRPALAYAFAVIAFVLWPIYVPISIYRIQAGKLRRKFTLLCLLSGLYIGVASLIGIIQTPVSVTFLEHSISYHIQIPPNSLAPYLIAVSVPFLISSDKSLIILGCALLIACASAAYFSCAGTFPSVWCFYAAILSLMIYLHFRHQVRSAAKNNDMSLQHST